MKIVVITRCLNEEKNIDRFMYGYDFADRIIVSDGGSTDNSIEKLKKYRKINLLHFEQYVTINGYYWNPDNPHINFIINKAKEYDPDWIILDDFDDVPNYLLRENARELLEKSNLPQLNAFRLYMWGDKEYFPAMNNYFDDRYRSLWAWRPRDVNISADENQKHGTIIGYAEQNNGINLPMCLLHKSWHPDTIQQKIDKYNAIGLPHDHPLIFAGKPEILPEWAKEFK